SSALAPASAVAGRPRRLRANAGRSFIGSYVLGLGFVLAPDEARALIDLDPKNREVLCPYLNGDDLTRHPDQAPARWIINFRDWPLARAELYQHCLARVRERVKPQRDRVRFSEHARLHWWQYERPRAPLYAAAARAPLVLACARVAKYLHFVRIPKDLVASEQLVLVISDRPSMQAILQSAAHEAWTLQYASTLDTRRRYTPTDCLDTFPMPPATADLTTLTTLADRHDAHRRAVMQASRLGLTRTYNRFHEPGERAADLAALRDLHALLDRAVTDAYGWSDLELDHDFHLTTAGRRFTISAAARRELQERLLALNHARHHVEMAERGARATRIF
ncbi:MAG: restriction endonuclease, partial [Nannocystis sp.]